MNLAARLLDQLKLEQTQFALDALKRPAQRDSFEYGYRAGVVAGYEAAITCLLTLLDEEKHSDHDL